MNTLIKALASLTRILIKIQKTYTMNPDTLYVTAKNHLGQHLTLNPSVPSEVGCAEAVSTVLTIAGIQGIPAAGIAGTASLYDWLKSNTQFIPVTTSEPGDIIISPTGAGNGRIPGHTGIMGIQGIMSNDSNSGLFLELWTLPKWEQYYGGYGGLPIYYFRCV